MQLLIGTLISSSGADGGLVLASEGRTPYRIYLAEGAEAAEKTAADELAKYLREVTGAEFSVVSDETALESGPHILVGASEAARKLLPEVRWNDLGGDGIVIKTQGDDLVLAGGRPRGSLYAVYQFLENSVGCRWWTPTESSIPKREELSIDAQALVYVPPFAYREHLTTGTRYDAQFATRLGENGHYQSQPLEWGGHYEILGFVHTFSELLPPRRYFAKHPEWYTDQGNQNRPSTAQSQEPEGQQTQLCLSNPEVLAELTKQALEWIRKNPHAGYISISQNDNSNYCMCPKCQAVAQREGSESGSILLFVNAVAAEIAKEYPHFWVETLAYTYSETPPRSAKPAKNVVIRLALALADYGHPLDSEWNAPARELLTAWSRIAPNLFIWSYATNFKRTMFPHPNWSALGEDLQFFTKHNVRGVFVQGDCYTGDVGDFPQLRAWLMGKLLWDPTRNQRALTKEFLEGYYGAAAPFLQQYIDLLTTSFLSQKRGLNTNNRDFSFLTLDTVDKGEELFAQARAAVEGDPVLLKRVRREKLSLDIARIARDRALRAEAGERKKAYPSPEEVAAGLERFRSEAAEFQARLWGENITIEQGLADLQRVAEPSIVELPDFARKLPRSKVIDFQPEMMTLAFPGVLTEIRDDPDASSGKAVAMKTDSVAWLVQAQLGPYLDQVDKTWRVFAVVRPAEGTKIAPGKTAFEGGIFDDSDMKHHGRFTIDSAKLSRSKYSVVDLGAHRLTPGMMVWFAPHESGATREILFDRILLVDEDALP